MCVWGLRVYVSVYVCESVCGVCVYVSVYVCKCGGVVCMCVCLCMCVCECVSLLGLCNTR